MANAFNIDKGGSTTSDTHLINETFHVFSKSPGSPTTSLGGARLKSGHTTTTSDVWADEIPAFFKAATQAKFDLFSTKAVKDDLCLFNGNVYQHNGTQFVSLGTEAEVLVDGATFKKNDKDVVKFHKGRTAINLTADNNNGDGSNNYTAKIYDAATGSTTFVPQFISAMDKVVDGIPSLAYDAAVFAGGSQLAEGLTADNDYICNAYAGVIQFNKARSQDTVTVSAWEYIGDKLTTTVSNIESDIAAIEQQLGLGEGDTTPVGERLDTIEESLEVLTGADTVEGSIAKSIKDAVEALDVAETTTNGITVSQTDGVISVTVDADAEVTKDSDKVVTSGAVEAVTSALDTRVETLETTVARAADEISATHTSTDTNVTVTLSGTIGSPEVTVTTTGLATAQELSDAVDALEAKSLDAVSTGSDFVQVTVAGTVGDGQSVEVDTTAITEEFAKVAYKSDVIPSTATGQSTDKNVTVTLGGTVSSPTVTVETTGLATDAEVTEAIDTLAETTVSSTSTTAEGNVTVTLGGTVGSPTVKVTQSDIASAAALTALETKVNKLHETGVSYKVVDTLPATPTEADKGYVYLVKTGEEGESALSGAYLEYIAIEGDTEGSYKWEKIGTTAADLTDYVTTIATANGVSGTVSNNVATITVQDGDTTQKGIVQLTDTVVGTNSTLAVTGKAVDEAITGAVEALDVAEETKNGITYSQTDGLVALDVSTATLVTDGAIVSEVATGDEDKFVTAAQTLEAIKLAKPENYVASVTGYTTEGAEVTTTQGTAVKILDSRGTSVTANDLWGTSVTMSEDGTLTIAHDWITYSDGGAWNTSITKVEDNKAYVGDTLYGNIQTERIKDGSYMFQYSEITSFNGDLSALVVGYMMFCGTQLTSFNGDLSSLTSAEKMFTSCPLTSFNGDLSSIVNGSYMF